MTSMAPSAILDWYTVCANCNIKEAQYQLAMLWEYGLGNDRSFINFAKALYWYKKCQAGGRADTQFRLGQWLELGIMPGIKKVRLLKCVKIMCAEMYENNVLYFYLIFKKEYSRGSLVV